MERQAPDALGKVVFKKRKTLGEIGLHFDELTLCYRESDGTFVMRQIEWHNMTEDDKRRFVEGWKPGEKKDEV